MRSFCMGVCWQLLADEVMVMAYASTRPDSWPLLYALDMCWTTQYVKSLI